MNWVMRTIIVDVRVQPQAAFMCEAIAGESGKGMFTTQCSPDGSLPCTAYISSGMIDSDFAYLLTDPALVVDASSKLPTPLTLAAATQLLSLVQVLELEPFSALDQVGLKLIQSTSTEV
jgi:hypothetical protein